MEPIPEILGCFLVLLNFTLSKEELEEGVDKWLNFDDISADFLLKFEESKKLSDLIKNTESRGYSLDTINKKIEKEGKSCIEVGMMISDILIENKKQVEKDVYNFIKETDFIKNKKLVEDFCFCLHGLDYEFASIEAYNEFMIDFLKSFYQDEKNKEVSMINVYRFFFDILFEEENSIELISSFMQKLHDNYQKDNKLLRSFTDALISLNDVYTKEYLSKIEIIIPITTEEGVERQFKCCMYYLRNFRFKKQIEMTYNL